MVSFFFFFQFEVHSFAVSLKCALKYTALSLISHRASQRILDENKGSVLYKILFNYFSLS